ncbi:MAG: dTDP-4-dehydrorhamnose reductase [Pseudomonadales bacterium]|nr:dTDP-4-dehydrorhamnose reductase [Gammaproteobacteria bacterium]NNL56555.1 dTDP-4-dehydrorhamnose reductase [Pseudomonadales bacterium]
MNPLGGARKILVTGDRGQLGCRVINTIANAEVVTASSCELDLRDSLNCASILDRVQPDVIINCAAYTAVDDAEHDQHTAFAVNADGPKTLASWSAANDCHLVHVSTDYVFSGSKPLFESYLESDATGPVSIYGKSKLLGEENIRQQDNLQYSILRTAWLYGAQGRNFLKTMLRLVIKQPEREFKVVSDQFGSPTSADSLTRAILGVVDNAACGTFHATSHGYCSWFELACEFFAGLGIEHRLAPCTTAEYPTAARRPANSILANARLNELDLDFFMHWRDDLALFIESYGSVLIDEAKATR